MLMDEFNYMEKYWLRYIEDLLEKYWAADTSLEEEKILRNFFVHTPNLPPHLQAYAEFFITQQAQHNIKLPADFDEKLLEKLGHGEPVTISRSGKRFAYSSLFAKIAASIVILLGTGFFTYRSVERKQARNAAVAQARETIINALTMIADNVQKGEEAIDEGLKQFEILSAHEHKQEQK